MTELSIMHIQPQRSMPTPPTSRLPLPSPGWALLATLATTGLSAFAGPAARALPMKKPAPAADLKPFPAAGAGEVRWVVRLPKEPPASPDPALSAKPRDIRVELIVGREVMVDCNLHFFNGTIEQETIQGWGYPLYRVTDVGPMASTRKACPPDQPTAPGLRAHGHLALSDPLQRPGCRSSSTLPPTWSCAGASGGPRKPSNPPAASDTAPSQGAAHPIRRVR